MRNHYAFVGRSSARTLASTLLVLFTAPLANADVYGHWPLDDGQGDIARDLGPRAVDATIFDFDTDGLGENGSVWVNDPDRGTVVGLGGNTAWVSAGTLPLMDLENDFSWSFWARQHPDQISPANDIVIGNRYNEAGADTVPREFIKFTPDRFEYHMNNGAVSNDLQYDTVGLIPSNDEWIHHSLVKDGETLTYYRNGAFGNSNTITQGQVTTLPLPYAFGGQPTGETWQGYLSDVQLYDSAVSQEDIQNTIMSGASLDDGSLYARYELNDGSGDFASSTGSEATRFGFIYNADTGGLGPGGSVWVEDPERGTVLGLADSAWVEGGELPIMDLEQDFTWTFWARQPPDQPTDNDIILGNRWDVSGVDTVPAEWIKFTPNRFEFHMNATAEGDVTYVEGELDIPSNDEWISHIAVKEGDQLRYYRNGQLENQRTIVDPMLSPDPLPFGMGGQNGVETWQGYLSDVRLFDHALSESEIDELSGGDVVDGIPGDYNGSGLVEQGDLDLVLGFWGSDSNDVPATWVNDPAEGFVDQAELDKVLGNWGASAAAAAVPEPASWLLAVVCMVVVASRLRRR